jgi:hypothetical protein
VCHGVCGIRWDVTDGNIFGLAGLEGDVIVPRPGLAKQPDGGRESSDGVRGDVHLFRDHDFCVHGVDEINNLVRGSDVINVVAMKIRDRF